MSTSAARPASGDAAGVTQPARTAIAITGRAESQPWSRATPSSTGLATQSDFGRAVPGSGFKAGMSFRSMPLCREGHVTHPNWRTAPEAARRGATQAIAKRKSSFASPAAVARALAPTKRGAPQEPRTNLLIYRSRHAVAPGCPVWQGEGLARILLTVLVTKGQKSFPSAADKCSRRSQSHAVSPG